MSDSFFPEPPPAEAPDEPKHPPRPPWAGPPDRVIPGIVPIERVIARSPSAVVALTALQVYPTGLVLELVVMAERPRADEGNLLRLFHAPWADAATADERFRLGVQMPDGTRAIADAGGDARDDQAPAAALQSLGGGGDDRRHSAQYWLWPRPTGPWELVLTWPANGIPETRFELEAAAITAAAARAQVLFEDGDPALHESATTWRTGRA